MRRVLLSHSLMLATAVLAASASAVAQQAVKIGGEWEPKPAHKPKRGKPTKAEKKAAKRSRTRGVRDTDGSGA
jgi:hypothetical protein